MEEILKSLYVVNKMAKQSSRDVIKEEYDISKAQLYDLKRRSLQCIVSEVSRVELHNIHCNEYYCLYFDDGKETWCYHIPEEDFAIPPEIDVKREEIESLSSGDEMEVTSVGELGYCPIQKLRKFVLTR